MANTQRSSDKNALTLKFTDFEHRLSVRGMAELRKKLLEAGLSTCELDPVLKKVIEAPPERSFWERDHEER